MQKNRRLFDNQYEATGDIETLFVVNKRITFLSTVAFQMVADLPEFSDNLSKNVNQIHRGGQYVHQPAV